MVLRYRLILQTLKTERSFSGEGIQHFLESSGIPYTIFTGDFRISDFIDSSFIDSSGFSGFLKVVYQVCETEDLYPL